MIPLRTLIRLNALPTVTLLLIAVNVACFLFELSLGTYPQRRFIGQYALVPDHLRAQAFVTSMFLHGGWMHLIGNMWFLWLYGSRVEDTIGSFKYLIFYLASGVAAAAVHVMMNLGSPVPTVGASGAIAGVMGAFLLLYPRARIITLIFVFIFITTVELPASLLLIYWFVLQFFSGLLSIESYSGASHGGVAWFAHIGGFLAGMLFLSLFYNRSRRRNALYYE